VLFGEHQLDVRSFQHRHLKAAEVNPGQVRVRLSHVPRSRRPGQGFAGRCLTGLRELVCRLVVQVTAAVTVTGAASPTEH
jgi:hypothetical protein